MLIYEITNLNGQFGTKLIAKHSKISTKKSPENNELISETIIPIKNQRMFCDENIQSFFRRLAFTPDGSLLIVPCGQFTSEKSEDSVMVF